MKEMKVRKHASNERRGLDEKSVGLEDRKSGERKLRDEFELLCIARSRLEVVWADSPSLRSIVS